MRFTVKTDGFYGEKMTSKLVMSDMFRICLTGLLFAFFVLVFLVLLVLSDRVELLGARCAGGEDSAADVAFETIGLGYGFAWG